MARGKNKLNQFTRINPIEIKLTKQLQKIADEVEVKVKPIVRDELEATLRAEIYASRTPATEKGQTIKTYNETHKHQKPKLYHHTGKLERSVYATIEGDIIKANIKDETYDNGASTTEVYDYLKFGTTNHPKNNTYAYANGTTFSKYIPQEPHNFEARTKEQMDIFLKKLKADIEQNGSKYINPKYIKKLRKSDM